MGTSSILRPAAFKQSRGAGDRKLADGAVAEAAAHDDPFRLLPTALREIAAENLGEFAGIVLDGGHHQGRGFPVVAMQQLVDLLLGKLEHEHIAERILALPAQLLAPVVDLFLESRLAGAVADKAFLVLDLVVVGFDGDGRQIPAPC